MGVSVGALRSRQRAAPGGLLEAALILPTRPTPRPSPGGAEGPARSPRDLGRGGGAVLARSLSPPAPRPHLGSPAFLQSHPRSQPPPVCIRTSARSLPRPHQLGTVSPPSSASLGFLACAEGTAILLTGLSEKAGLGKGQLMGWTREAAGSPGAPDFDHQGRCGPRRLHPRALPGGAVPGPSSGGVWGASGGWRRGPVLYGTRSPERGDTLSPLPSLSLASPWRGVAFSPGVCNSLSPPSILVGSPTLGVWREDPPSHRLGGACGPPGRPDLPASAVGVGGPPRGTKSVGSAEEAWLPPPRPQC